MSGSLTGAVAGALLLALAGFDCERNVATGTPPSPPRIEGPADLERIRAELARLF